MYLGGTQQLTLQDAERQKTKVFPSARAAVVVAAAVAAFISVPQRAHADAQPDTWFPAAAHSGAAPVTQYRWGADALTLSIAEGAKSRFFPSVASPVVVAKPVAKFVVASQADPTQLASATWDTALRLAGAAPVARYSWGADALALASAERAKSGFFEPSIVQPAVVRSVASFITAAPQLDPSQPAADFSPPIPAPVGATPAALYRWGADALAIAGAEGAKSRLFAPSSAAAPIPPVVATFVTAAPQADPTQAAGGVWQPQLSIAGGLSEAEYSWGTHAAELASAEGLKSQFFFRPATSVAVPSPVATFVAVAPQGEDRPSCLTWQPASGAVAPVITSLWAAPQQYDLTQQAAFQASIQGQRTPIIPTVIGAPLQVDLAQQALFDEPIPSRQGAVPPITVGVPQADPSQLAALVWGSQPAAPVIPNPTARFFAQPPQTVDLTQQAMFSVPLPARQGTVSPLAAASPQADPSQISPSVWASQISTPAAPSPLANFFALPPQIEDRPISAVWESLLPPPPTPVVVLPKPAGGDSGDRKLRRRPLYYWEAAKLRQMAQREVEESLTEELAYAEATLPRSHDDFYERINHIKEIGRRLDSIKIYRDLAKRVESVVARMEETRITVLADTSEEDEINDLIQFL
jgi:hypothetical protein